MPADGWVRWDRRMPGLYLPFPFPHTQTASEVVTHISPPFVLLWPWTHFLTHLPTVLGRGRLESMLSAVPKGPGAASATGHLPPLPTADPGGGAQGQRGRGHGPCTSRRSSAPVPVASSGCDLRHPGQPTPHPVPGRTGGSGAAGAQQTGCGAPGPPSNHSSSCPRLLLPYPNPGLARVSPAEVRGEQEPGPESGR